MRFRTLFLVFLLAELVSYTAYFFPTVNRVGFFVIVAAALIFSLRRLEYGLYFILADLILGGKSGLLFSFEYSGFVLSLRMALFIVVMAVWLAKVLSSMRLQKLTIVSFCNQSLLKWWGVLGVAVVWGVAVGIARHNNFGDLFLDVNGYFYGALVLPALWAGTRIATDVEGWPRILKSLGLVFFVATTLLALKTLFAVYLFTHAGNNFIAANLLPFYRWVRDTGVGEITTLPGNFARVFFQSHIYNIAAFFVILNTVILRSGATKDPVQIGTGFFPFARLRVRMTNWKMYAVLFLNTSVIVVSLSRSFWVGTIVGLSALGLTILRGHTASAARIAGKLLSAVVLAVLLIFTVARFPFPKPSPMDLSTAVQGRLAAGEAGASRWNLLSPLFTAVMKHPIIGSGFGTTVTYISNDPRIREVSPTGAYTTYAFEWGWLDVWLKMGLLGLAGFAGIIIQLARVFYRGLSNSIYSLASLMGLASLAAIHFFTPYLNHPLGFGLLIFFTLAADLAKPKAT